MCEPISASTAAYIAMGTAAVGTAVSIHGQNQQKKYATAVAENNARYAEDERKSAIAQGAANEVAHRQKVRQLMGLQRAAMGANGMDITSGTGAKFLEQSAEFGEIDAQTIRANTLKRAWGLDRQADQFRADGKAARLAGRNNMYSTLLTGGSQVYGAGKDAGIWGKATTTKAG